MKTNVMVGDNLCFNGDVYTIEKSLNTTESGIPTGFQFRVKLVRSQNTKQRYVAKITDERPLYEREERVLRKLKLIRDSTRYYAQIVASGPAILYRQNKHKADYYVILEKIGRDCSYEEYLTREPSIEFQQKIISKVERRIKLLHENGICHCDLLPGNILVTAKGESVRIIDFDSHKCKDDNELEFRKGVEIDNKQIANLRKKLGDN